jgi:hypothetical protein
LFLKSWHYRKLESTNCDLIIIFNLKVLCTHEVGGGFFVSII